MCKALAQVTVVQTLVEIAVAFIYSDKNPKEKVRNLVEITVAFSFLLTDKRQILEKVILVFICSQADKAHALEASN